jgi:tight adherence protein C
MDKLNLIPPALWLLGALGAAGAATFVVVMLVRAPTARLRPLLGYRLTDRKEALEQNGILKLIWPLVDLGTGYAMGLQLTGLRTWAAKLLRDSGAPLGLDVDEFFGLVMASTAVCVGVAIPISLLIDAGSGIYVLAAGIGMGLPVLMISDQIAERFKSINRGLPQALDLVVMAMGAGLDFTGSLRNVVDRWTNKKDPMYKELNRFSQELNLGKTRREGLEDLAERAPTQLVRTFVANVIQAEQRGTPLVEILAIQADVARTRRFQAAEEIAGKAGVKVLMPLMLIFLAVVLIMFGGVIVKSMRGQLTS